MARVATKDETEIKDLELPSELGPAVHHMVRGLGAVNDGNGIFTADQLDAQVQTWLDQGYKLAFVDPNYKPQGVGPGGMVADQATWHILYIFVRE